MLKLIRLATYPGQSARMHMVSQVCGKPLQICLAYPSRGRGGKPAKQVPNLARRIALLRKAEQLAQAVRPLLRCVTLCAQSSSD